MTITVHDKVTGENLNAREVSREVARRDDPACHLCGCHGWTPDRPLPAEVSEPQCLHVIADRSGRGEKAYPRDNWQDVSHAAAVAFGRRWADLHDMAAEFSAWLDSLPGVPEHEWAELPPDPARELTPEALDAEHDDRARRMRDEPERYFAEAQARAQARISPRLTDKWRQPADDPAPVPEPRHLLRAELRAFRDDLRRAWTELRAWRPWKRGER